MREVRLHQSLQRALQGGAPATSGCRGVLNHRHLHAPGCSQNGKLHDFHPLVPETCVDVLSGSTQRRDDFSHVRRYRSMRKEELRKI